MTLNAVLFRPLPSALVEIIGPHATELIAEACVAMQLESTAEELGRTMHAHPTVSEAVMEAAEAVHDVAVHI